MSALPNLQASGDRIERLLDDLQSSIAPHDFAKAEELVRLVTELYGAGLARVVDVVSEVAPDGLGLLAADDLVSALLMVHDLHPDSLPRRVEAALEKVRPLLASHGGDVELLDIDEAAGAVLIRLLGSCDGCPSSAVTLQMAVEAAITKAAPEISIIDVEPTGGFAEPAGVGTPVTLTEKPRYESCPSEMAQA
jgi:Fe-S cluster biogenesis protein NfuA